MGFRINHHSPDLHQLTHDVALARRHIDQAMAELARARDQIPAGPDDLRGPTNPDDRRDLSNACIALELALEDSRRWARDLADRTRAWRNPDAID